MCRCEDTAKGLLPTASATEEKPAPTSSYSLVEALVLVLTLVLVLALGFVLVLALVVVLFPFQGSIALVSMTFLRQYSFLPPPLSLHLCETYMDGWIISD